MSDFGTFIRFKSQVYSKVLASLALLIALFCLIVPSQVFSQSASTTPRIVNIHEVPEPSGGSFLGTLPSIQSEHIGPQILGEPVEPNAPPVGTSIEGINFNEDASLTGFYQIPPDPIGAAGPGHLVSVVNSSIEWFTKAGVTENSQTLASFFTSLSPLTLTFDPKVIYDQYTGCFVVITLERTDTSSGGVSNTSRILVAVSDDSDPNGTWYFQAIDSKILISGTYYWADYPGLGVDEEAVYVTNNLFTFGAVSSYGGARLWIIHKTPLYSGGSSTVTVHDPSGAVGESATTTQPAHMFGAGPTGVGTFLVRYSGYSDGVDEYLSIIRVDDPLTAPTFSHQFVTLGNIDVTAAALPDAPQLGTAIAVETNDRRALNAVWRNNGLWVAMTVVPPSGVDASQATAHWVKVNTSTLASLVADDQGDVSGEDIAAGAHTFFPSVAVDASGNMGIGFALSAASIYPGAYFTGRLVSDPAGTVQSTGTLRSGLDYYNRRFGGSRNRWGDYSGISVDPSDNATFWLFNEYALTRGTVLGSYPTEDGRWGTAFGSFKFTTPPPTQEWVARYNGSGSGADKAKAIVVDDAGNVYVTGTSIAPSGFNDYATIKYDNDGVKQWTARYNGTANNHDEARAIAVDDAGNVYVTGSSIGASGNMDYATVKYNSAGVKEWAVRYNGPANSDDAAYALTVDDAGNVYVSGYSTGSASGSDYFTIKYNSSGARLWVARYNGPGNSSDEAHALAVDGAGNVYVTGWSNGTASSEDYATIKYNSAGAKQWAIRYNGPGNATDKATGLAFDIAGNVYVTGHSGGASGFSDYATIAYNSSGVKQWEARYNGGGNNDDSAFDLALDPSANVFVTGASIGASGFNDYATVKYNSAGVRQWVARYNGPGNDEDGARSLAVDDSGSVFVTGYSTGTAGATDYATVKYNSAGVKQWALRYNGKANGDDEANDLALDSTGNIYVTGFSIGATGTNDYATVKYSSSSSSAAPAELTDDDSILLGRTNSNSQSELDADAKLPASYDLAQNYPNPFNPVTTIRFDLPNAGRVKLAVYNMRGGLVRTLVNGEMSAGHHQAKFNANGLASGVYLYRLEAGTFTTTRKLVLEK